MGLFNKILPGIRTEDQIRFAPDMGANTSEGSGGPMRPLFVKVEDVFPTVESEKNNEIIERAFSQVFSVENNKDVKIFSQKKDDETTIGTYLRTSFYTNGALDVLKKMFIDEFGNVSGLGDSDIDERIKAFCLENLDKVECPIDTRTAIIAVCNKGKKMEPLEVEKVDEKLESRIDAPDMEICRKLLVNIFDMAKKDIERTQIKNNLKLAAEYFERFEELRTDGLSPEEMEKVKQLIAGAKKEVARILAERTSQLDETEKNKKREAEDREKKERETIVDNLREKFENAIGKIVHVSSDEFDDLYAKRVVRKPEGDFIEGDYAEKIRGYIKTIPSFLFDAVDAHSQEEIAGWESINNAVNGLLDENSDIIVAVVDGEKSYAVKKEVKGEILEEDVEGDVLSVELPNELIQFLIKRAEKCLNEIKPIIEADDDYKLLSKDELNNQIGNYIKIFIRKELLRRSVTLANDKAREKFELHILDEIMQK